MSTENYEHPPYKTGTKILESQPLVYTLSPGSKESHCAGCFTSPDDMLTLPFLSLNLRKCGNCGQFSYCSRECQTFDWKNFHKHECKIYAAVGRQEVLQNEYIRLFLRTLILIDKRPDELNRQFNVLGATRSIKDLEGQTWMSQLRPKDTEDVEAAIDFFQEHLPCQLSLHVDKITDLLHIVRHHSFRIPNSSMAQNIGLGFYIEASIFGHSCAPNSALAFEGSRIEVRAIKDISAEENICISFCDPLQSTRDRKERLMDFYFIDCKCDRCTGQSDDHLCNEIGLLVTSIEETGEMAKRGEADWDQVVELHGKVLALLEQVYGRYHPALTCHKLDYFFSTLRCPERFQLSSDEVLENLKITHGPEHLLTKNFDFLRMKFDSLGREEALQLLDSVNV